jgi:hypothetical protein
MIVSHKLAVVALAYNWPEPVANPARLHVHRSLCFPYMLADGGQDPPGRFWATG